MARKLVILISVALLCLGLTAAAASAVPPDMETAEWVDNWYIGECDGFSILTEDTVEANIKTFYNKDGSVNRIHFHFTSNGFVYNSEEPSKTLGSVFHENAVTDENFEIWTQSGLYYRVDLPQGVVLMDAGRFIVDVSSGFPVFDWQGGNHQILEGDLDMICAALS